MRFVFVVVLPWFLMTAAVASDAVPSKDAFKTAEAKVNSVYADDITAAKSPMANRKLADHLVKVCDDEKDPSIRYVLLTKARDASIDIPDPALGYRITEKIVKDFSPVENHTSAEWIALGDEWKAKAKGESEKTEAAKDRLFAVEFYLRAYPNTSGIDRDAVSKRIETLGIVGSPRDRERLLGVWTVNNICVTWNFHSNGNIDWRDSQNGNTGRGKWRLEPTRVYIQWDNGQWDSINRPFTDGTLSGDGWSGACSIRATKGNK